MELAKRRRLVEEVKRRRRHHGIERSVIERKMLCRALEPLDPIRPCPAWASIPSDMSTPYTSSGSSSRWIRSAKTPVPQPTSAIRLDPWARSCSITSSWAGR
ncbi:hypothetical protein I553_8541 [Mycobacterium xenopi 4042]|uniref:Uncharacterized protein n=1 Tax=Mycobacterium xenopi 4042 TaxID=1299334 RepID=X8CM05_MYCXE|nr:hypothetical protein I552_8199 [Mycobacterium xenopi 3993]EUA56493.1 hypothetical protein I553_8541 [Mycobacterium xenopi 4042]